MPAGYQIPVLGCPPGVQQQQLAAMAAGLPVTYSGLQGYNFVPYAHHRPITHMVSPSVPFSFTHLLPLSQPQLQSLDSLV